MQYRYRYTFSFLIYHYDIICELNFRKFRIFLLFVSRYHSPKLIFPKILSKIPLIVKFVKIIDHVLPS